jgi:hypothetical protein
MRRNSKNVSSFAARTPFIGGTRGAAPPRAVDLDGSPEISNLRICQEFTPIPAVDDQ